YLPVYAGSSLKLAMFGKAPSEMSALQPYRGKPAVRNDRGDRGNVGIIEARSAPRSYPTAGGARQLASLPRPDGGAGQRCLNPHPESGERMLKKTALCATVVTFGMLLSLNAQPQ